MERIKTRFAANVDVARVLPEYPRPQLVREGWMNLNGLYDYAVTPHGAQQPERFERASPHALNGRARFAFLSYLCTIRSESALRLPRREQPPGFFGNF